MEYSFWPIGCTSSAGSDPVQLLVSFKSATFSSQNHLPWHVSKNGVNIVLIKKRKGWNLLASLKNLTWRFLPLGYRPLLWHASLGRTHLFGLHLIVKYTLSARYPRLHLTDSVQILMCVVRLRGSNNSIKSVRPRSKGEKNIRIGVN